MKNAIYTNTLTLLHSPTPLTFPLLYNKDIIVNLYKLHFLFSHFSLQPNKKVFHPPTFPPLQPIIHKGKPNLFYHPLFLSNQTKKFSTLLFFHPSNQTHLRENQIFSVLPLFHSSNQTDPKVFSLSFNLYILIFLSRLVIPSINKTISFYICNTTSFY